MLILKKLKPKPKPTTNQPTKKFEILSNEIVSIENRQIFTTQQSNETINKWDSTNLQSHNDNMHIVEYKCEYCAEQLQSDAEINRHKLFDHPECVQIQKINNQTCSNKMKKKYSKKRKCTAADSEM